MGWTCGYYSGDKQYSEDVCGNLLENGEIQDSRRNWMVNWIRILRDNFGVGCVKSSHSILHT
jgi:hypothetical protein